MTDSPPETPSSELALTSPADPDMVGMATPTKPELTEEIGVSMNLPFGGWSGNESELRNADQAVQISKLIEMRRKDGQVRALMRLLTLPIRAATNEPQFIPGEGDKGEAEFVENMLMLPPQDGGMTTTFSMVVRKILLAIVEGFSAFEVVPHIPTEGPLAGKWTIRKIAYRPSTTITFLVDDTGGFNGLHQRATFKGRTIDKDIPLENSFYYAANEEENPFYGISYFETAFYHWDKKVKLYYLAHIAAQQAAVAGRIGTTPVNPDAKDKAQFIQALASFGFNTAMVVPDGYGVTPWKSDGSFDFLGLIDHHNGQMSKSVLAQFIDRGDRSVLIDNAEKAPDDLFLMGIQAIMDEIADTISNHLIPRYIGYNFQNPVYPRFKFGQLGDATNEIIKEVFNALAVASTVNVTPEFVHELEKAMSDRLGLEIDYTEIDKRLEEENELAAEARKAGIEQAANNLNPDGTPKDKPAPDDTTEEEPTDPDDVPATLTGPAYVDLSRVAELLRQDLTLVQDDVDLDAEDPDDVQRLGL